MATTSNVDGLPWVRVIEPNVAPASARSTSSPSWSLTSAAPDRRTKRWWLSAPYLADQRQQLGVRQLVERSMRSQELTYLHQFGRPTHRHILAARAPDRQPAVNPERPGRVGRQRAVGRIDSSVTSASGGAVTAWSTARATDSGRRNLSASYRPPSWATTARCMSVSVRPG